MNIHSSTTSNHSQPYYSPGGDPYHFVRPTERYLHLPRAHHQQYQDARTSPLATSFDQRYSQPTPITHARVVNQTEPDDRHKRYRSPRPESSRSSSSMDNHRHRHGRHQRQPEPETDTVGIVPEYEYKRGFDGPHPTSQTRHPLPTPAPAHAQMMARPPSSPTTVELAKHRHRQEGRRHSSRCQCCTCHPPTIPRSSGDTHTHVSSPAAAAAPPPDCAPAPAPAPVFSSVTVQSHKKTIPTTSSARRAVVSKFAQEVEEEMTCPICMSVMVAPHQITPCGHAMCGSCGVSWLQTRASTGDAINCPTCRETVDQHNPLTPARNLESMIGKWVENKVAVEGEWDGLEDYEDRKERWAVHKMHNPEEVFPTTLLQQRSRNEEHPANIMFRESPSGVGALFGPLWDTDDLFSSLGGVSEHADRMRDLERFENDINHVFPRSYLRTRNRPPPTERVPEIAGWPSAGDYLEQEYQNGNLYREHVERGRLGDWTHQGMPRGFNMPDMFNWLRQRGPPAISFHVGTGGSMPTIIGVGLLLPNDIDRNRIRRDARPPRINRQYGNGPAGDVIFDPVDWQWR